VQVLLLQLVVAHLGRVAGWQMRHGSGQSIHDVSSTIRSCLCT
jgi:hypothetical protein